MGVSETRTYYTFIVYTFYMPKMFMDGNTTLSFIAALWSGLISQCGPRTKKVVRSALKKPSRVTLTMAPSVYATQIM